MTEENRIKAALARVEWPSFVKEPKYETEIDLDASGERALWVWVIVSDTQKFSEKTSKAWAKLSQSIRDELAAEGVDLWAYVRAREESVSRARSAQR